MTLFFDPSDTTLVTNLKAFPSAEPRARPKRCEACRRAGRAAGKLPPGGGREECMKGPRRARMPVDGVGSKCLGRTEKETEWRRFHAPQAPGNSHCTPTAPSNSHSAPTLPFSRLTPKLSRARAENVSVGWSALFRPTATR